MWRLNYVWRLTCTGIAFAFIFFGGGLLAVSAGPVSKLMGRNSPERMRKLIRATFRFYLHSLQFLGLISLNITGEHRLNDDKGRMVIANHPSLLDVVILMATIPRAQCIVKSQLWNHRFLGSLMRSAGFIRNDMEPEALIAACRSAVDNGQCLIIFPEGTRTTPGALPRMQRGFANVAILAQAAIQPVYITCAPPTLIKGEAWWHIPPHKPHFEVAIDEFLDAAGYVGYNSEIRSISARKLVTSVEKYYRDKMQYERP